MCFDFHSSFNLNTLNLASLFILQIKAYVRKEKEQELLQAMHSITKHLSKEKPKLVLMSDEENSELRKIQFSFDSEEEAFEFKTNPGYSQIIGLIEVVSDVYSVSVFKTINI